MRPILTFILLLLFWACERSVTYEPITYPSHQYSFTDLSSSDVEISHSSYVPVFSDIYHIDASRRFLLTATLSIRNISWKDTVYLFEADYYDPFGKLLRNYLDSTLVLLPMESVELVVEDKEHLGGAGAKFIVNWGGDSLVTPPYICAVMIGTSSQQGLSFITEGIIID